MADDFYASLPDDMLARLLFSGDEKAYKVIYERYWRSLYSVALWKTNDTKAAEELVQELFMQLWENRQRSLIQHLEAYLKTALRYSIITFIKNRLAVPKITLESIPDQSSDDQADTPVAIEELTATLKRALEQLPEKTRLIFHMNRFERRSAADIAQHLGLTERAVEYHITQSLRLLRLHLKDYLPYSLLLLQYLS